MKTDPYIFQILTQNWTHAFAPILRNVCKTYYVKFANILEEKKIAPILRNVCKIYVNFDNILEIFFENFAKIGFWKILRPIDLLKK